MKYPNNCFVQNSNSQPHINDNCIDCGACIPACPFEAIHKNYWGYVIDPDKCNPSECGSTHPCVDACPVEAIEI